MGPAKAGHYTDWTLRGSFTPAQIVAEDDRFGDLLLRLPTLTALTLDRQIRLFLRQPEVALQDALGAIENLPCLEPLRQLRVLDFKTRGFDLGANQKSDRRDQLHLAPVVIVRLPVLSRGKLVGVINLQHRQPHNHSRREMQLISTIGFLVGAEIETARLEVENTQLSERLETRKILDRAKGILQRDLGLTEEEAYLTIQRQSRQRRKSKKEIAEAIILGDDLRRGKSPS